MRLHPIKLNKGRKEDQITPPTNKYVHVHTHMNNLVLTKRWLDIVINFYNTVILLAVSKALICEINSKQGNLLFYGFEISAEKQIHKTSCYNKLKHYQL